MATISKTKSGTWKAAVRKRGFPPQIRTFRLKIDAQDWARGIEDEIARGVFVHSHHPGTKRMTVAAALDRYLEHVTPTKKPGSQVREHARAQPLRAKLGAYSLAALTPEIIAEYRDERLRTIGTRSGRAFSPSSVRLELVLLSHLYKVAIMEWGVGVASNPCLYVRKPAQSAGRTRRLVGDEEARLLAACDAHSNPMFAAIVRLALATGMRHGEIVSLRDDQIEMERRVIRLSMTKNGSARTVPLSNTATCVLREALACPLRRGSPLVFPGDPARDGSGQRKPYTINRTWKAAVRAAGLEDFRFHDLRHEAISRLVERGLSDQEVSAISGHKSMQMLRRYTHLRAEDLVAKLG